MDATKTAILNAVDKGDASSLEIAKQLNVEHKVIESAMKSLEALEAVTSTLSTSETYVLTDEGKSYITKGSPEFRVYTLLKEKARPQTEIEAALGKDITKLGFGPSMKKGWIALDKATKQVSAIGTNVTDETKAMVQAIAADGAKETHAKIEKDIAVLKKNKCVEIKKTSDYTIKKGAKFALDIKKAAAEITAEMIANGSWKTTDFKAYNFNARGKDLDSGNLHPLMKVKAEMRQIFLLMGFQEMKTNQWVESSFWNFDTLFQPQQHPARDAHDTFFMKDLKTGEAGSTGYTVDDMLPREYLERVKKMHQTGGAGSTGWKYEWSEEESRKLCLRTHTTSVSARTLYQMGQEYKKTGVWTPRKCFSCDRVFRNETIDSTHLAEFYQIEGFIADRGLSLGHMMGVLREFFRRLGIEDITFKPAYNPYTEPSMEIFRVDKLNGKIVEVGNSGVFRPEMLSPMGIPSDVRVIAWGLGMERPTMQMYAMKKITQTWACDIPKVKEFPVSWIVPAPEPEKEAKKRSGKGKRKGKAEREEKSGEEKSGEESKQSKPRARARSGKGASKSEGTDEAPTRTRGRGRGGKGSGKGANKDDEKEGTKTRGRGRGRGGA